MMITGRIAEEGTVVASTPDVRLGWQDTGEAPGGGQRPYGVRSFERSEAYWKTLFEDALDGKVLTDERGRVVAVNRAAEALLGRRGTRLLGRSLWRRELLEPKRHHPSPTSRRRPSSAEEAARAADQWPVSEKPAMYDVCKPDGSRCCVELRSRVVEIDGQPRILSSLRATDPPGRVHHELRERREQLRLVGEQMFMMTWTTDRQLRFLSRNGSALAYSEAPRSEAPRVPAIGSSLYEFLLTVDPDFPAIRAHERALAGESVEFEGSLAGVQGRLRGRTAPLRDPYGEIIGVVGVATKLRE